MIKIVVINRDEALKLYQSGKKVYHLTCEKEKCRQEFYFATNKVYSNLVHIICPTCYKLQRFYLEEINNYRIYKWQI